MLHSAAAVGRSVMMMPGCRLKLDLEGTLYRKRYQNPPTYEYKTQVKSTICMFIYGYTPWFSRWMSWLAMTGVGGFAIRDPHRGNPPVIKLSFLQTLIKPNTRI